MEHGGRAARIEALPPKTGWLLRGFTRYGLWFVRRHFHAVRLQEEEGGEAQAGLPLVVYSNHPSWWDPMVGLVLWARRFRSREAYAPIDERALRRYPVFGRLGFFPVEQGTARGARQFLRAAHAVLARPGTLLWVTAEGEFRDVRARPVRLRPGLGLLAARVERAVFLPVAVEYGFGHERLPEAYVRLGVPVLAGSGVAPGRKPGDWTAVFEAGLERTQDRLAAQVVARDFASWTTLVQGGAGAGGFYDSIRRVRSWARGERFDPRHESVMR